MHMKKKICMPYIMQLYKYNNFIVCNTVSKFFKKFKNDEFKYKKLFFFYIKVIYFSISNLKKKLIFENKFTITV